MISGVVLGVVTAAMLATFIGIAAWAYGPGRRDTFERASRLPFADEDGKP